MPTPCPVYHAVLAAMASDLDSLAVTGAHSAASVERRLRRALCAPHLTAPCVLDESTKTDQVHLLRLSLAYRGGAIPLAWTLWTQQTALAPGAYWQAIATVLDEAAAVLPADLDITLVADRAVAVLALLDQLTARGWHWVIRLPVTGQHRFQTPNGTEAALATVVRQALPGPGTRFRTQGRLFKKAHWRPGGLVDGWAVGQPAPLVVMTDRAPRYGVLATYARRAWIESSFRADKAHG